MFYVLLEIWVWVVAAGLLGAAFGWWMRSIRARREVAHEAMLWQSRMKRETPEAPDRPASPETVPGAGDGSTAR